MNRIVIEDVRVMNNRLECYYTVHGDWNRYFKDISSFFAEYAKPIDSVPKSIAVIPFLCNVLPLVWVFDGEVILEELDLEFYESIEAFKQGYINMYPKVSFQGRITPKKLVDNGQEDMHHTAAFFSGGVDAYHTLISHMEENPILVTLWGADITFEDQVGWRLVDQHITRVAAQNNLEYISIKTSFRRFLEEGALSNLAYQLSEDNWWYGYQHGIGIIGHMAPLAYQYKIRTVYIASSLTAEDNTTCASDPTIDNHVRFCGAQVVHDGYEYSRQDKTNRIGEYVKRIGKPIQLRVCWESEGGSNCCHCEKCYRTILCLLAGGNDPRDYGFLYSDLEFGDIMKDFKTRYHFLDSSYIPVYQDIQNTMRKTYTFEELSPSLLWFYKADLKRELSEQKRLLYRLLRKGKNMMKKLYIPYEESSLQEEHQD